MSLKNKLKSLSNRVINMMLGVAITIFLIPAVVFTATTIGNNVSVGGTLTNTGAMFASSTLLIGDAAGDDNFYVQDGAVTIGNASNSSTLAVFGNTTITGSLLVQTGHNNLYDLGVFDSSWNDVFASGTAWLGVLFTDGNVTLGDAATDTLTVNADVASNILPEANGTRNLGAYDSAWNDVFASGTMYSPSLDVTTVDTGVPYFKISDDDAALYFSTSTWNGGNWDIEGDNPALIFMDFISYDGPGLLMRSTGYALMVEDDGANLTFAVEGAGAISTSSTISATGNITTDSSLIVGGQNSTTTLTKTTLAATKGTCENWTRADGTEVRVYVNNSNTRVIETGACQ